MKHIITLLAAVAVAASASAAGKQHSTAGLEVTYQYEHALTYVDSLKYKSDKMLLQVAPDESRYFSIKTEFYDSLKASPGGSELIDNMVMDALNNSGGIKRDANGNITSITVNSDAMKDVPRRGERVNVYKYHGQNVMTVFDCVSGPDAVFYTWDMPLGEIDWQPGDSVMTILGYECQNAVADYHGRRWTAWYAPDIPVSDGPWQFSGLPGLILKACSDGDEYRFTATAINECKSPIKDMAGEHDVEKCSRKDFRKLEAEIAIDPGKNFGLSGKNMSELYHDLIETDYK